MLKLERLREKGTDVLSIRVTNGSAWSDFTSAKNSRENAVREMIPHLAVMMMI